MPHYSEERLPITIYAEPGTQIPLTELLTQAFGDGWTHWTNFWFRSFSAESLRTWDFSYWNPTQPLPASWSNGGNAVAPYGSGPDLFSTRAGLNSINLNAGNSIMDTAIFFVETTAPGATDRSFAWYHIKIVDDQLAVLNHSAPTAADVVAAAYHMDAIYRGVPNPSDCGWITDSTGSAAGAVLPLNDQSIIPTENREGGFWRIAHRGTDNAVAEWQTLVRPGDIVRVDWINSTFHTTLVVQGQDSQGNIVVFDNAGRQPQAQSTSIGIHSANWDELTDPRSITIYRLTTDNLYLLEGNPNSEILAGTHYNDLIRGLGGSDQIYSQSGNDQIYVTGVAGTIIDGGSGFDTLHVAGSRSATQNLIVMTNVERVHFTDAVVAFDTNGNAGDAYRIYQAAFDRTPDRPGLSYWVNQMDDGMPLSQVALNFILSPEFTATYGNINAMTNAQYVDVMYENVLHRDPDPSGFNYWMTGLGDGYPRHFMLAAFSQSAENQTNVVGQIGNGIVLDLGPFL